MARHLANHERREFTIGWERKAVVIEVLEQDGSLGVMLFLDLTLPFLFGPSYHMTLRFFLFLAPPRLPRPASCVARPASGLARLASIF
jgi:hypothetical protein